MTDITYVLIDANILILAFDTVLQDDAEKPQSTKEQQKKAKAILNELIPNPSVRLVTTPLIRYEVLRGVKHISFEKMKKIIDRYFTNYEIFNEDGHMAAKIFKIGNYGDQKNINKHNFDIFHYSVTKNHQLEWKSLDKDFSNINELVKQAEKDNTL